MRRHVIASSTLDALARALGPQARRDEPVAPYTAMQIGGPANVLVTCETVDQVVRAVRLARRHELPWRLLGGGCNVLVADEGLDGVVIINRADRVTLEGRTIRAETGAQMSTVARLAVEQGLAGLAWATGLPGSVGGAVVGNAGAFEGNIAGVLTSASVYEPGGDVTERPAEWFEFDYRLSRIKRQAAGDRRPVVLEAAFQLEPGDPAQLAARAREIREWRRTRHPSGATVGSTFKNPPGGHAGYLIEQAGLRGYRIGGVEVSEIHGNFLMNVGGGTAADMMALIDHIQREIKDQFDIDLELEIELIGRISGEGSTQR